jgi:hypothetical protein
MPHTDRYRGVIRVGDHGDSMDVLFLGDEPYGDPLAEEISEAMEEHGSYLSVRYWMADVPLDDAVIERSALGWLLGEGDVEFHAHYSEITGYLYTTQEIEVGGHDLLAELSSQAGRYCLLEITYSKEQAQ